MSDSKHPYRSVQQSTDREQRVVRSEEMIVYSCLTLIGAIPVSLALFNGTRFGVEATIGIIMLGAGILGFLLVLLRHGPTS